MSVGHVARAFEAAGLPTTAIYVKAFRHQAQNMGLARAVITRHPMGRPVGPPHDEAAQYRTVKAALDLLPSADGPRTIVDLTHRYVPVAGHASPSPP